MIDYSWSFLKFDHNFINGNYNSSVIARYVLFTYLTKRFLNMKKCIFLFLLLSSQFAYGEPGIRTGWGDNPDTKVIDAVEVHVYTTTGTDPFMLGSTSTESDFITVVYDNGEDLTYTILLINEVSLQQLGDRMVFLFHGGDVAIQLLPDTEIHYHFASP